METWHNLVRRFKDVSENPYLTNKFADTVFHDLQNTRIREKQKFKNRMGPEFEQWIGSLSELFPRAMLDEMLFDDEFWATTIALTLH